MKYYKARVEFRNSFTFGCLGSNKIFALANAPGQEQFCAISQATSPLRR